MKRAFDLVFAACLAVCLLPVLLAMHLFQAYSHTVGARRQLARLFGQYVPPELVEAMRLIASTGKGPEEQVASIGCSIKWKTA